MKPRTAKETAMICVAAVLVVTVLTIPFEMVGNGQPANTRGLLWAGRRIPAAGGPAGRSRKPHGRTTSHAGHPHAPRPGVGR